MESYLTEAMYSSGKILMNLDESHIHAIKRPYSLCGWVEGLTDQRYLAFIEPIIGYMANSENIIGVFVALKRYTLHIVKPLAKNTWAMLKRF